MSKQKMSRRDFSKHTVATVVGATLPLGCTRSGSEHSYESLVSETWSHSSGSGKQGLELMRELVRYGTLAANSHNTQAWKFLVSSNRIDVLPDFSRRCPAVDPDDHHLFATLGCASENIVQAAAAHGLFANVALRNDGVDSIRIDFEPTVPTNSVRFQAIPERQCTRADYDGKAVSNGELSIIESSAQGEGVSVRMFTDERDLEQILEYVVAGNTAQMNDKAFMQELKEWVRFSERTVVEHRDGLFSSSSGNPTVPEWLGRILMSLAFTENGENDKYRGHIRSSAGVIAFIADENNKESWVEAGRSYQRFALQTTAMGMRNAFINQAVEVPAVRAQFATYLGIGERRPNLLVRFGYGPELPRSLRRPIAAVIV